MDEFAQTPPPPQAPVYLPWYQKHRRLIVAVFIILVVALAGSLLFKYKNGGKLTSKYHDEPVGLVLDKVSQSAPITVNLPPGVQMAPTDASSKISFDPKVLGTWTSGPKASQLVFKPESKLDLGKYYTVSLSAGDVHLTKDFLADEDPKVAAVFPNNGSEAGETSQITVEFNRPMVPLTSLDVLEKTSIPVTISPATAGKFKWATTRTLEFIPDKRLQRSSNYKVSVGSGFVSMDGLAVEATTTTFTTRPLRYESSSIGNSGMTVLYDQPISIHFNQPVDLDKTRGKIEVKDSNGNNVGFDAEYGSRTVALGDMSHLAQYADKSVIEVFQSKDKFGRAKFWDNNAAYSVTISGAVPVEGDIMLNESRSVSFKVPDIIASFAATSDRSNLVDVNLFDPKGKLVINFFEGIDKDKSSIKATGLKSIDYGQQCKLDDNGDEIMLGSDCLKEPNKKQLLLSFDENALKPGQSFDVELAKIVNVDGLQLNSQSLHQQVQVYPQLQILSTTPSEGGQAADVGRLTICTNSPLEDAQPENFYQRLQSNVSVGKWSWDQAYKVTDYSDPKPCPTGQYANPIRYSLQPQTHYEIQLNVVDEFGQTASKKITFTSGKIDVLNKSFTALQKDYNVASPEHTKLTYAVMNLDYVNLQVCQVTAQTMMQYLDYDTTPNQYVSGDSLNCVASYSKQINLPPKYWSLNYFQVDIKDIVQNPLGYYVLSFSNPDLREQVYDYKTNKTVPGKQIYDRTFLNVTNIAAQEKKVEVQDGGGPERSTERNILSGSQGNLYWISQIGSLDPISGATVDVYVKSQKKYNLSDTTTTDSQGVARAKAYAGTGAAVVTYQNDSTIVGSYNDKFQWASSYAGGDKTYIYSDRPIYRPGQDVDIKGLYRIGYDAQYDIYQGKQAHLVVYSSKNEPVSTQDLPISNMGTFNTVFSLPADAPLGTYRIEALGGYYTFDVEEYVPSAFKLDLHSDKDEYIAGDTFKVGVDANYYFGVPVESGKVEYTVLAQDYYFDRYQDSYFNFGGGWYYSDNPDYGDNFILRGKADLDSKGHADISQTLDFNKLFNEDSRSQSKIFVVRVTVTNSNGQQVSGEQSFIVHRGEFYLGVTLQNNYFAKNQANKILIKSVDTQGKEKAVGNITGTVSKVTWNYYKRQEVDGNYYYHSDKKLDTVDTFTASTDDHGNYSKDFTAKDEGEYEVTIKSTDSRGNPITSTQEFYVYGSGTVEVQPLNNESLDIAVNNNKVEVGGQGQMVIKSPFAHAKALIAVERGRILDYQIVNVDQSFYNYTFDVKDAYVPNVFVTVLLLSPDPQVKFGQAQFIVDSKDKTISVETKPDKNNYLPGEQVTLDVTTKDSSGKPVPAEVSLSVADLSVLALAGNPKKDPVSFFYDGRPLGVTTSSNLKNILEEAQIPTGTKGGGGAEPGDLATKKRGVFKDTAYWNGTVQTGNDGHARVQFTLPDNLTTWQIESVGLTQDTKLGVGYSEFVTKKQLMVTPLYPRFVIPGDEFVVGGKIFNQTGGTQTLQVNLDSSSLTIEDNKQTSVTIQAGDTKTVYFKVKAPENKTDGVHDITITAKNDSVQDSVENTFPIRQNQTYEAVATSNYTTEQSASEYVWLPGNVVPGRGGVQIQTSATMIGVVPDALQYLVAYPYGCTEQMVSKIASVAVIKRFVATQNLGDKFTIPSATLGDQTYSADDVVRIGLSRILANQTPEGGFSYYPGMQPDYYLTLDVLEALEQLRSAGYQVDASAEARAVDFVYQKYLTDPYLARSNDTLILTAYILNKVPGAASQATALRARVAALASQTKYVNEDISNLSLTYLAMLSSSLPSGFADQIFNTLENRIVVDGRGAYLNSGDNNLWQYYETPVKDTALFVKALSLAKRDYQDMDKVLRWIKNSRSKDGSWGSTNNTLAVIDALAEYLRFKPETQSNFTLQLLLDNQSQGTYTFDSKNILNSWNNFLPTSSFTPDKLSKITFTKTNLNNLPNGFYYDMVLKYYLPVDSIAPRDEGFAIDRKLYALDDAKGEKPLTEAKVGDVLRGHLTITVTKPRNFVSIESFIPAGMELVNFNLATENQNLQNDNLYNQPGSSSDQPTVIQQAPPVQIAKPGFFGRIRLWFRGLFSHRSTPATPTVGDLPDEVYSGNITSAEPLYPDQTEFHDDRLMLFDQQLQPGVYEYDYYVRALIPGKFQHLPAVASELYQPENFGRTGGDYFTVKQ